MRIPTVGAHVDVFEGGHGYLSSDVRRDILLTTPVRGGYEFRTGHEWEVAHRVFRGCRSE